MKKTVSRIFSYKYLRFLALLVVLFSVFCQVRSLVQIKGFWLDEWFVLYNIKFKSFSDLFGNLFAMQQFPRVYLSIIKFIAETFNYNYFALRVFPFSIQLVNIFLVYFVISKIVFPLNKAKSLLFVLFFLSFHTTLFYFSQIKQYTMDIFFALLSIWYYDYLSRNYASVGINSFFYTGFLFFILAGPFFSYTFPIVVAPVMLVLLITFISEIQNRKVSLKAWLPIGVFIASMLLNYFTDLQFVLHDKGQYHNFDQYVMNYSSLSLIWKRLYNIAWLFTSIFFFDKAYNTYFLYFLYLVKVVVLILSVTGLFVLLKNQFEKMINKRENYFSSFNFFNSPDIQLFFLLLFVITVVLYLFRLLPVGTFRINYFCFTYITYFLVTGLFFIIKKLGKLKPVLLTLVVFAATFPAVACDICELKNTNLDFDQNIYNNVGNAIRTAGARHLPIVVQWDEFYPASLVEGQESLMIKTHHEYKPKDSIPVFVFKKGKLEALILRLQLKRYVLVSKDYYHIDTGAN